MKSWLTGILTLTFVGLIHTLLHAQATDRFPRIGYSSWLPAASAEHAMLLGNGEMGAMVFGHPHDETIILNHSTLYLPLSEPKRPVNQAERPDEIKQGILNGKGKEAELILFEISMTEEFIGQVWSDPHIPAFNIKSKMSAGKIEHYKRQVLVNSEDKLLRVFPSKPASCEKGLFKIVAAQNLIRVNEIKWDWQNLEISLESAIGQTINIAVPKIYKLSENIDNEWCKSLFQNRNMFASNIKPNETIRISFINTNYNE